MPHGGSSAHTRVDAGGTPGAGEALAAELQFVSHYRAWRQDGFPGTVRSGEAGHRYLYSRPRFAAAGGGGVGPVGPVGPAPMNSGTYVSVWCVCVFVSMHAYA